MLDAYEATISCIETKSTEENNGIPVFEEYYGKLPEFSMIEQNFRSLIDKARKEKNKANPNKYPENAQICKMISKIFGFKKAYIYWIPSNEINAFTINCESLLLFGESKDYIEKRSDRGFYDTSHRSVLTVYAYTGILDERVNFTERELFAIILHEIGHNFDYSLYHMVEFLTEAIMTLGLSVVQTMLNKEIDDHNDIKLDYYDQISKEGNKLYKNQRMRDKDAREYEKSLRKYLKTGYLKEIANFLMLNLYNFVTILNVPMRILTQIASIGGHKGEHFADSFATAYGYGSELISGLEKMNAVYNKTGKSKGVEFLIDLNRASMEIFMGMSGEVHGTNQERAKECIKKLKADLRKEDFPEGMKAELEAEIAKVEERYRVMLTATEDEKYRITKLWRRVCNILFGGANNIYKFFKANKV